MIRNTEIGNLHQGQRGAGKWFVHKWKQTKTCKSIPYGDSSKFRGHRPTKKSISSSDRYIHEAQKLLSSRSDDIELCVNDNRND